MIGVLVVANARPARCARRAGGNMRGARRPRKPRGSPNSQRHHPRKRMIRFQSSRRSIAKPRRTGYLLSRVRAPFLERRGSSAPTLLTKILGLQFDRRTMRRAVGGVVPGIAVAMQGIGGGDAL